MAQVQVVVGACGGVGASTLAALLAQGAGRLRRGPGGRGGRPSRGGGPGASVALVDLSQVGGGVEVLLGLEERPGARWPDLRQVRGSLAGGDLVGLLPVWSGVEVLSADRRGGRGPDVEVLASVWAALLDGYDVVVADLPAHALVEPGLREVVLGAHAQVHLLTGQDVAGVAAALALRPLLDMPAPASGPGARLVLRRVGRARVAPLEAAHLLDLPLAGLLPTDRAMAAAVDRGLGPVLGPRTTLARSVRRLGRLPALPPGRTDSWLFDLPAAPRAEVLGRA